MIALRIFAISSFFSENFVGRFRFATQLLCRETNHIGKLPCRFTHVRFVKRKTLLASLEAAALAILLPLFVVVSRTMQLAMRNI